MKFYYVLLVIFIFAVALIPSSAFVVSELNTAIIVQFGRPVTTIKDAGLYWKIPFIQDILYFDKRILSWDGQPNQIPTRDKKYIWVDTTARWRIVDPLQFYRTVRNERGANQKLNDIIDGTTRDIISNELLIEIVRNTNRSLVYSQDFIGKVGSSENSNSETEEKTVAIEENKIDFGRDKITEKILKRARGENSKENNVVENFGIEIFDVLIKRVNYTTQVREKVYARMISERKKVAEYYRAEGRGERAKIIGRMEKKEKVIRSESYRTAEEIRGKADAKAAKIYAESYNLDPNFYAFLQTLKTYETSIDGRTKLILSTDSDYLRFFKGKDHLMLPENTNSQIESSLEADPEAEENNEETNLEADPEAEENTNSTEEKTVLETDPEAEKSNENK